MKHTPTRIFLCVAAYFLCSFLANAQDLWLTDYKQALALAQKENKKVLLDFTGSDWCPACMLLSQQVFSTTEFKNYAKDNLVLVELDFPNSKPQSQQLINQNKQLLDKYNSDGVFPTIILLNSDGSRAGKMEGYLPGPPSAFIGELKKMK